MENQSLEKRPLGSTGIMVTPLCYGCASAFARDLISDETASSLFRAAIDAGIRFFDTGHSYGCAEERIGKTLRGDSSIRREDLVISTKFGTKRVNGKYIHDVSVDWAKESVELSLKRMGIDYIDILYIHGPEDKDLDDGGLRKLFDDLKSQGVIRAVGVNTFDSAQIDRAANEKLFDAVMLDYNIVRQDREPQIERLHANGIGVVAGQAMAESVFLNDLYKVRSKKDLWYLARTLGRTSSRKLYFEARKYRFMNHLDGIDGSQAALKYVLDNPGVSSAACGTCSFDHLRKNVEAAGITLPQDVVDRIHRAGK